MVVLCCLDNDSASEPSRINQCALPFVTAAFSAVYLFIQTTSYYGTVILETARVAAAAQIYLSYSPGDANVPL